MSALPGHRRYWRRRDLAVAVAAAVLGGSAWAIAERGDGSSADRAASSTTPRTSTPRFLDFVSLSVTGAPTAYAVPITLSMREGGFAARGRLVFNGGCNELVANYTLRPGRRLHLTDRESTTMACSTRLDDQADWFDAFIEGAAVEHRDGGGFTLRKGDAAVAFGVDKAAPND